MTWIERYRAQGNRGDLELADDVTEHPEVRLIVREPHSDTWAQIILTADQAQEMAEALQVHHARLRLLRD